jgi:cellulose synthase (UDP-forming)
MTPATPSRLATTIWTLLGFLASAYYFSWLLQPARVGALALFALLAAADLFNGFHAVSFWLTSLRRPRTRPFAPPAGRVAVDVLVPTYNEPESILEPTVRAAAAMRGADVRVFVLDDGGRDEIRRMAARLGVGYIARGDNEGAKSGNINVAVAATADGGADYICVFDSDHVPDPGFLEATLGYFTDASLALVQTPQVYRNAGTGPLTRGAAEQQAIFFGPISTGRDGFDASFCCGTNFVIRRAALDRAGGFPMDSITEDIVLSARLVGLGYGIAYVPTPLSTGLGPEDAKSYGSQQLRWATGCLELLFRRRALWRPLSWTQRWQYFVATSYWLTGWTILVYLAMPVLRLAFGWQALDASADAFAIHFLPYFLVAIVNLGRFTNGAYTFAGLVMNWGSFAIHLRGTVQALTGRRVGFQVTPKHAVAGSAWRHYVPNLAVAGALLVAAGAGLSRGLTPATFNNLTFASIDVVLVVTIAVFATLQARQAERPAGEERPRAGRRRFGRAGTGRFGRGALVGPRRS